MFQQQPQNLVLSKQNAHQQDKRDWYTILNRTPTTTTTTKEIGTPTFGCVVDLDL